MIEDFFHHDSAFWSERFGPADQVADWHFYAYEWIDDLSFMPLAKNALAAWNDLEEVLKAVKQQWTTNGWDGDGDVQLLWLPPFVDLDYEPVSIVHPMGIRMTRWLGYYVLHVKQLEDGISWLASPAPLPWLE